MSLLKIFVMCAVLLVGMSAHAEDAVRVDDSPAADPSSGASLSNAHYQAKQGAETMAGSGPSGKSDYARKPKDEEQTSSSDLNYFPSDSDEYECEEYSDPYNPYSEDNDLYASDWFSEGHGADVKILEATRPGKENRAHPKPARQTPAHSAASHRRPAAKTAGKAARRRGM